MISRLREAALWMGAALGLLSVVAGTAVMFFGFTFLIFRSGSMGPEIPTGSLALARTTAAAELETGDVVSVIAYNGERITHRLVSSTLRGDEASVILQGDANGSPDDEIYQVTEVERSIVSLPYLGYVFTVLLSPAGLVGFGCLSGMLILTGFGSTDRNPTDRTPGGRGGRHRAEPKPELRRSLVATGVGMSIVAAVVVVGPGSVGTSAFFTDKATVRTGNFASATLALPASVRCVDANNQDFVTWNAPTGPTPTGYRVFYTSTALSGQQDVTTITNYQPPASLVFNRTYSVTVATLYRNWVSAPSPAVFISSRNSGTRYRCETAP